MKKSNTKTFLDFVEKIGNKLPHPITIFIILSIFLAFISHIMYLLNISTTYMLLDPQTKELVENTKNVESLLNISGIRYIFTSAVKNFTNFIPLGTVIVSMIGISVAESTGFISTCIRKMVLNTPSSFLTASIVFVGVMSNVASDAGYLVLIPLGATIFHSAGRHPIAGLAAAFAGVSGGFSANLIFGTIDILLSGITSDASKIINPDYTVNISSNWYFMSISTLLITLLGVFVTEKIIEPRLGIYNGNILPIKPEKITQKENKSLFLSAISILISILVLFLLTIFENSPLRDPSGAGILSNNSPFINSLVFIIMLLFLIPGIVYGFSSSNIKNDKDVIKCATNGMSSLGGYLLLSFFASQFINYFNYTNIGTYIAIKGANFLQNINLKGLPLIITFILITAIINLFMGSASAKWLIMAPIFIPMFMSIGISPELTQVAYRIGDSTTNLISPLMSYFALIVTFSEKYDKKYGIGTIVSSMLPYSIVFLFGWILLMTVWYLFKLPLGPNSFLFY